jgi:hypothetical protein
MPNQKKKKQKKRNVTTTKRQQRKERMTICEGGHIDILALILSPTVHLFTIPS